MMKDLKHYFSSPKVSDEIKEANSPQVELNETLDLESMKTVSKEKTKKKKRKRKLSDSDVSLVDLVEENFEPTDKKKRKKSSVLKVKNKVNGNLNPIDLELLEYESSHNETPKGEKRSKNNSVKSKKSRDSSSSKENSTGSDAEEKVSVTPDSTKNLLNYFNKVDKLPEIVEQPRKIKVEVLVHADSSGSPTSDSNGKKPSMKKRKSSKRKSIIDFDLITSEELFEDAVTINGSCNFLKSDLGNGGKNENGQSSIINGDNLNEKEVTTGISNVESKLNKNDKTVVNGKASKIIKKSQGEGEVNVFEVSKMVPAVKQDQKPRINKSKDENVSSNTRASETKQKQGVKGEDEDIIIIEDVQKGEVEDEDVIVTENELPKEKSKAKHDGTLASFFNLGNKLPPLALEKRTSAKIQFLLSGAPPSAKRITTNLNCQGTIAPFPSKSHLQQKDRMNILWNLSFVNLNFKSLENDSIQMPIWCSMLEKSTTENNLTKEENRNFDKKTSLKELKKELNLFPISCWVKEVKKMKKGNDSFMWTERYRPRSSSAFLANTRSISKLKAWLTELKETSITESGASSSDEFVKENDPEHLSNRKTVILLTGPPGTGKTASVYAVAEEIGYNVLEINASSNRSGKRILNEFSEAMQSHKVGVSKLNFSKKKPEEPKRNLILIEDADLIFEDDEGFVPTLMNLGASAKRPLILVANNQHAKHFGKLSTLFHATLPFMPPTQDRLGSWLRTVSAVEGFHLGSEQSKKLASSQDLRNCLLQLQLMLSNTRVYQCSPCTSSIKNSFKENEKEAQVWESISDLDFSSRKSRRKAQRLTSALASLDLVRQKKRDREVLPYWHKPLEDSTLNLECMSQTEHNLEDIEASLLGLINMPKSSGVTSLGAQFEVPKNLLEVEKDVCSLTSILNRRSLALDYWSALRHISRNETARLATHTKRNNRYFNYLSSLGVKGPPDLLQSLSSFFS